MKEDTCCVFGHRKIEVTDELVSRLQETIENLIVKKKIHTFLFGSKSDFDRLCLKIVTGFQKRYPYLKRIYVRAEFPHIDENYTEYLLQIYDHTYYPEQIIHAGKAAYIERNYEMIDKSSYCVIFYDENYMPLKRKNSKKDLFPYQPNSGTKLAYAYAVKKGLKIMNMYNADPSV